MAKTSQDTASQVKDFGVAVDQGEELLGYTVNFVSIRQTHDLAPLLKGLPDDLCQCPHWGYVTKGRMTVHYLDRDEVIEAGDAFYMPPGHSPAAEAGTELIQFSPTRELQETEAAIMANVQAMHQG
jgi:hypothetical protein